MNLLTKIIASIRYPQSAIGRTLQRSVPILLLVPIFLLTISGLVLYQIMVPPRMLETVNPANFMMAGFRTLNFSSGTYNFEGWLIPSLRQAPVIILCHGYKSNRSELLTLAATLQENGYNLFLLDFRGHGSNPAKATTLGIRETADMLEAVKMLAGRAELNPNRLGIWGAGMGAYIALSTSVRSIRIKAMVIDSAYESPSQFVADQTPLVAGVDIFILKKFTLLGLSLVTLGDPERSSLRLLDSLESLQGRPKLFITNEQEPELENQTKTLFNRAPFPKEIQSMKSSGTGLLYGSDRKRYEVQVLDFFKTNLPIRGSVQPPPPPL
jgi:pimeloyl-ACP methyl ester carboxylesterase